MFHWAGMTVCMSTSTKGFAFALLLHMCTRACTGMGMNAHECSCSKSIRIVDVVHFI